jgi:hypothetical protein
MTANVDEFLGTKDTTRRSDLTGFDAADIADLSVRAADPSNPFHLRALNTLAALGLADSNVGAAVTDIVDLLLSLPDLDAVVRAAVLSYAAVAHSNALSVLLLGTADAQEDVAIAAWRALQLIARSSDLADLQNAAPPPGGPVGDQAAFTMALIAYRGGVAGFELPILDETHIRAIPNDEEQLFSINQSPTNADEFALISELTVTEMYLLAADITSTTSITCGGQQLLLCLDPEIQPALPATLTQAPAMPGLIAIVDPSATSCAPRFLLLSQPDGEGGFFAGAYLPSGEQVYQGHAHSEDITAESATLSWFALNRPGVRPISLTITVGSAGLDLTGERLSTIAVFEDLLEPAPVPNF